MNVVEENLNLESFKKRAVYKRKKGIGFERVYFRRQSPLDNVQPGDDFAQKFSNECIRSFVFFAPLRLGGKKKCPAKHAKETRRFNT